MWTTLLLTTLRMNCPEAWCAVMGTTSLDSDPGTSYIPDHSKGIGFIVLNVVDHIRVAIEQTKWTDANRLWLWLKAKYGVANSAHKSALFTQLTSTTKRPLFKDFSMTDHIHRKTSLMAQLNEGELPENRLSDKMLCYSILHGLPVEYEHYMGTLNANSDKMTKEYLCDMLLSEESRIQNLRDENPPPPPAALYNQRRGGRGNLRGRGDRGGRAGGRGDNPRWQPYPKYGGRGRGGAQRGGRGAGRGSGRVGGWHGQETRTCYKCGQVGHISPNCPNQQTSTEQVGAAL